MTIRLNTYYQLFCAFLLVVFSQSVASATAPYPYTGEQLFQGIYFSDGPVSTAVKVLQENSYKNKIKDREALQAAKKFQTEIMTRISRKHPGFFKEFGEQIASRNHNKIAAALEKGSDIFYQAISGMMYEKTGQSKASNQEEELKLLRKFLDSYAGLDKSKNKDGSGSTTTIQDETNLIALVWVLAVAWEYAWVSDKFILPHAAKMGQSGDLHKEQLVNELASL